MTTQADSRGSSRSGFYVQQPSGYNAFVPSRFPPKDLDLARLMPVLSEADVALARLDGAASVLPNVDLFIRTYILKEAETSSQIEGTEASMADLLEVEAGGRQERRDAVAEIQNYVLALNQGLNELASLPVSMRLIRRIHGTLMAGVRGCQTARTPGELRTSQNWIGGTGPSDARFVPPPVPEMDRALTEWEHFLHSDSHVPPLIRVGLAHAQFETIHPFLDGNGRCGRLLVTFLLTEKDILAKPMLYLSTYLREHRDVYYDRLQATRDLGAWEDWLEFFLAGVAQVATEATVRVRQIMDLMERDRARLEALPRSTANAYRLLDHLFDAPVVTVRSVADKLGVSDPTANKLVADFQDLGLVREVTGQQRNRRFWYDEYLRLFFPS